jgi:hypothetical protein
MVPALRADFNARFTEEKYQQFLNTLDELSRCHVDFRVAETPCFIPKQLLDEMASIGIELTHQLIDNPRYMALSAASIPEKWTLLNESRTPLFMTVDFGLVLKDPLDVAAGYEPKLVELQAFPSIYGYQAMLSELYVESYGLSEELRWFLGEDAGIDDGTKAPRSAESYWALMRRIILGAHAPENVVLLEVDPENQKTLADFYVTADHLGIRIVDIAKVVKQGNQLFYRPEEALEPVDAKPLPAGELVPIRRIYNRAIVDEIERRGIELPFDYRDDLDVEWAGNPNWYFRISKFSLPFLKHPSVPRAIFLDELRERRDELPEDREEWVLKPLYSFAGKGIQFAPTDADLAAIPASRGHDYLVQERVHFANTIETPEGPTQAEIRLLYVWPEGEEMQPVLSLIRMGRGLMMGVDHNRDRTWVGGSAGLYLPEVP